MLKRLLPLYQEDNPEETPPSLPRVENWTDSSLFWKENPGGIPPSLPRGESCRDSSTFFREEDSEGISSSLPRILKRFFPLYQKENSEGISPSYGGENPGGIHPSVSREETYRYSSLFTERKILKGFLSSTERKSWRYPSLSTDRTILKEFVLPRGRSW